MNKAKGEEEKSRILGEIVKHLGREDKDGMREFALSCLRGIYSSGDVGIINRLWKECKSSFEIQPYNIIPIQSLTLNDDNNELGRGTFGCVKKGIYKKPNGDDMAVAVKIIPENSLIFDLSDLRSEVFITFLLFNSSLISYNIDWGLTPLGAGLLLFDNWTYDNKIIVCWLIWETHL